MTSTETTYALVRVSEQYGPATSYRVLSIHDTREEAETATANVLEDAVRAEYEATSAARRLLVRMRDGLRALDGMSETSATIPPDVRDAAAEYAALPEHYCLPSPQYRSMSAGGRVPRIDSDRLDADISALSARLEKLERDAMPRKAGKARIAASLKGYANWRERIDARLESIDPEGAEIIRGMANRVRAKIEAGDLGETTSAQIRSVHRAIEDFESGTYVGVRRGAFVLAPVS